MYPKDFLERMQQMLGSEYQDFYQSLEGENYQALRVNTLKGSVDQFKEVASFQMTPVPWAENGFYYGSADQPGKHPFHEAGVYYIQEPSAMAPAELIEAKPGERILDLCAAPGGKSTQLAAKMKEKGILVSNEIHPARARILSENIERMGIRNAVVTNETPQKLAQAFPGYFDKILVDAPCSGEGMFRKNEEACRQWSQANVELCAERQDEILDCAATMLRPGGRLVYSTCTFAPQENEGAISRFLERQEGFTLIQPFKCGGMADGVPDWAGIQIPQEQIAYCVRLWPHQLKGEGHFAAVIEKEDIDRKPGYTFPSGGIETGLQKKDCTDYLDFEREFLKCQMEGNYLKFGEQLYLIPEDMPSIKGLKVLRPGLHLGTRKKNRFEPSHALALTLKKEDAKLCQELSVDPAWIPQYLTGATFPAQGEKGWYLITINGYSIGWGKLAGTIMKNHYPKGLRKPYKMW